ncbi:DnaA regulatory inactivator Hda [Glaciimonas immobilis]|uniref:DnaA family protein n=1 Tax=Glaciimonas immobilis TaxID=728004 RepID=A0A840RX64_9BURK|nr:DnaA regulatory inactivator Hda [Glaciimonas immobilis]KAF3998598.1 DnaA regulatory inactivator Hda [Glaciimonas immobilis]MBB5201456.1 DnaA family protein [Glaciimonas immobilis]
MRQLLLDITTDDAQTLDTFVVGNNAEVLQFLQQLTAPSASAITARGDRFVYLWGQSGAGKSHLLQAFARATNAHLISAADLNAHHVAHATEYNEAYSAGLFHFSPEDTGYLIDDCDKLCADDQILAFALFNQIREHGGWLITSGAQPPAELTHTVREDLRTRLGWGLIYQLHGLSDEEKISTLSQAAQARGLTLSSGVLPYLITHFRRDMRSLMEKLDELDRYSLETKRPITLPLLRSLLQLESEEKSL